MPAIGNPEDGRVGTCGGGFYGDTLVVLGAVPAGENLDLMASLDQRLLQAADVLLDPADAVGGQSVADQQDAHVRTMPGGIVWRNPAVVGTS